MLTIREKILLDDNFASVVPGVREGRLIFNNLRRSIQYTLTHIMPEVLPQILYVVVPIPLPLPAILVLVIDLGFELALALSFAFDKPESEEALMRQQPRKPVNDRSVRALREKALRRVQTRARTDEEGRFSPPSKLRQTFEKIKAPFTRAFWQEKFQKTDDEKISRYGSFALRLHLGRLNRDILCFVGLLYRLLPPWFHTYRPQERPIVHDYVLQDRVPALREFSRSVHRRLESKGCLGSSPVDRVSWCLHSTVFQLFCSQSPVSTPIRQKCHWQPFQLLRNLGWCQSRHVHRLRATASISFRWQRSPFAALVANSFRWWCIAFGHVHVTSHHHAKGSHGSTS